MTTVTSLQQAVELLRSGQASAAEAICRRILEAEPSHAAALYLSATIAVQGGRLPQALDELQRAVAAEPSNPGLLCGLGEVHIRLGQWREAADCFGRAVALAPQLAAAHFNLAQVYEQLGDRPRAAAALEQVVRLDPNRIEAHEALARIHRALGQPAAALEDLRRLAACRPDSAEAHNNLGNLLRELGHHDEAVAELEAAVRLRPDLAAARYNLGNALRAAGKHEAAVESYRQALRLEPTLAPAYNNLGSTLQTLGRLDEAHQALLEAVRLAPAMAEAHHNLGTLLQERGQLPEARQALERAIELNPSHIPSRYNLSAVLTRLRLWQQARTHLLEILRLKPDHLEAHASLGGVCLALGDNDQALAYIDHALARDPGLAECHYNRGLILLGRGDPAGWAEYEWRWKVPGALPRPTGKLWNGKPFVGRTLALYGEQGRGDTLQFVRYAARVKALGGTVVMCAEKRMIPILSTCKGIDRFYHRDDETQPEFDAQASLMTLPALLPRPEDIPAEVPYLSASADRIEHWRKRLAIDGRLRVGINWQGNPDYEHDDQRSIPLAEFAPLARLPEVRLISLQYGVGSEQLAEVPFAVETLGDLDETEAAFCETAAVICNLDVVVTSDTALAHLAGALGARVWLALSRTPDWRWRTDDRTDSPWYPTMRLFRQQTAGQWRDVFERIADELRKLTCPLPGDALTAAFELHRAGRHDEAEQAYRHILSADPANAEAWHLLGALAHQRSQPDEAVKHFTRAIELDPSRFTYHVNRATALAALERREEAIASLDAALCIDPNHAEAHNDRGILLADLRRYDEAAAAFQRALTIRPDCAGAHNNLGTVLSRQGRWSEAIAEFQTALRLDPHFASAHNGLGAAWYGMRRFAEALAAYNRALELQPDYAAAHNNIGQVLLDRGDYRGALERFETAARLDPQLPSVHANHGIALVLAGDREAALAHFDRVLAEHPGHAEAHFSRAALRLSLGDYAAGWPEYEWRLRLPGAPRLPEGQRWQGESLAGRTILLLAEQGYGDLLQFIRYAPLIKSAGGRVVVRCPRRMIPLLGTCQGIDQLSPDDEPLPAYDVQSPLLSLPGILGTDAASIPRQVPYLAAPEEDTQRWRARLAPDGRLRVGINWQGDPTYRGDLWRSMRLVDVAPLAEVPGVRWISLQQGHGHEQLADASFSLEDIGGHLDEREAAFCETAAVIRNLDLVVTSDTAVAHLAGALGAELWIALPLFPDWRWLADRDDSPWYPTARLFRQTAHGRWSDVFARMADQLRSRAEAASGAWRRPERDP